MHPTLLYTYVILTCSDCKNILLISIVEYFAGLQPPAICTKCKKKAPLGRLLETSKQILSFAALCLCVPHQNTWDASLICFSILELKKREALTSAFSANIALRSWNVMVSTFHIIAACAWPSHMSAEATLHNYRPTMATLRSFSVVFQIPPMCVQVCPCTCFTSLYWCIGPTITRISKVEQEKGLWTSACTRIIWEATDFTWILVAVPRSLTQQENRRLRATGVTRWCDKSIWLCKQYSNAYWVLSFESCEKGGAGAYLFTLDS